MARFTRSLLALLFAAVASTGDAHTPEVPLPELSTPEARRRALVDGHAALGRILVDARAGRTVLVATPEPPGFLPVPRATLRTYLGSQIALGAVTAVSAQQVERQWVAGHDAAVAAAERQFAELEALISAAGLVPAGRSVTSAAPPGGGTGRASRPPAVDGGTVPAGVPASAQGTPVEMDRLCAILKVDPNEVTRPSGNTCAISVGTATPPSLTLAFGPPYDSSQTACEQIRLAHQAALALNEPVRLLSGLGEFAFEGIPQPPKNQYGLMFCQGPYVFFAVTPPGAATDQLVALARDRARVVASRLSGGTAQPGPPAAPSAPAPARASCDPPGPMAITDGQEAGVLLRTGECVRGVLIDMGADFTMQVGGAERRIAVSDVALIDFMAGGSYGDTDVSRGHVVALRTGATSRGELYDMSERRPLAVTIRGAGGEQRISSAEIAYIALADIGARPNAPATPAPGQRGMPSPPRPTGATPPSSPTRQPPASVPPPPASAPAPPGGMVAVPSETMGATGSEASIFGSWRACDGRMVAFAREGAEIIGRYTAIGGLPASLFSIGQVSHRLRQTGPGAYQGVVEHRFFDGRREWRDTVVAIDGDRYRDTGSDACSVSMTRIVADPGPAAAASVAGVGSGGCEDLSGRWSHVTTGIGSSVFTLTRRTDGRYDVTESGLGSGRGVAATSGNRLRYDFTWSGGAGFIDVVLDTGCTQGTGTLQFTAGQSGRFSSTLTRSGGTPLPDSHDAVPSAGLPASRGAWNGVRRKR